MTRNGRLLRLLALTGALAGVLTGVAPAWAQASSPAPALTEEQQAPSEQLATDIREAVLRVPATVEDPFGRKLSADLLVTTFRPSGPGPFPLVVISHGRASKTRAEYKRQRFESAARFFVRKGFAVAVPLRIGYGELASVGDPESSVRCDAPRYAAAGQAAADQIVAVVKALSTTADIDAHRIVLVGQSVGGFATIAATAERIEGQVAAIDFAGGHGGDPDTHPGEPCRPEDLQRRFSDFGRRTAERGPPVPTLWVFTENDRYFSARYQRRWSDAYRSAGGLVETRQLPPFGDDGHLLFGRGNDLWQPLVDAFLKPLGFEVPGALPFPSGGEVAIDDEGALPDRRMVDGYRKFLAAKEPRAFATNGRTWGYAYGDDAQSRALALCDRRTQAAERCRLYAVNRTVVWSQP